MSKKQYEDDYIGFVLGSLSSDKAEALARHASRCAECQAELRKLEETLHLLAEAAPAHQPPPHLKQQILNALQSEESVTRATPMPSPAPAKPRLTTVWAIAASLLAVVSLTAAITLYERNLEQSRQLAHLESEIDRLIGVNQSLDRKIEQITAPGTRLMTLAGRDQYRNIQGKAFIDPQNRRARIFLQNLPPLPEGRVFQLWQIQPGAPPRPSVVFTPDEDLFELEAELVVAPDQLASLAVSIESPGGSLAPAGPIVALGQF